MRRTDFERVAFETPRYVPVFRLTRIPEWFRGYPDFPAEIGTEVYIPSSRDNTVQFWEVGRGAKYVSTFSIGASYLTFVEYRLAEKVVL